MPSALTENEILSRHKQALSEAKIACERLSRNADPEYIRPRGEWYASLRSALMALEGSARQMGHFRGDGRWFKLGVIYGKEMRYSQAKFVRQSWGWFGQRVQLFVLGQRNLDVLSEDRTGRLGPILPTRPSDWLVLPNHTPTLSGPRMIQ
jgi:hypothetical protein